MNKLRYAEVKSKPTAFLALTSLTVEEFELLVPEFGKAFQEYMSKWRLDGKPRTQRSYTTYANSPLPTAKDHLLFVLSYVKGNPLQSNYGVLFGMVQGKTNRWLQATFRNLGVAPAPSVQELALRLEGAMEKATVGEPSADTPLLHFRISLYPW